MLGNDKMVFGMDVENNGGPMEQCMKDTGKIIWQMARVD